MTVTMTFQAASSGSRAMIMTSQRPMSPAGKLFSTNRQKASTTVSLQDTTLGVSTTQDNGDSDMEDADDWLFGA
jgi:hypothetical protein